MIPICFPLERREPLIPAYISGATKIIGYFCYIDFRYALCDGDACIIAGSEELMKSYLQKISKSHEKDIIKKTRFGEIIEGLKQGAAYAFDEGSYSRFLSLAKINSIAGLPEKEDFLKKPADTLRFIRIQVAW